MERRVFILLVLLIISVILNIFLATKFFKFKRIADSASNYTHSLQNKVNNVENKIEDKIRSVNKNCK